MQRKRETLVVVRGGGDIATGTIQKLWNSGFGLVILETDRPTAIRRKVALSQAVYEGTATVEDLTVGRFFLISQKGQTLQRSSKERRRTGRRHPLFIFHLFFLLLL